MQAIYAKLGLDNKSNNLVKNLYEIPKKDKGVNMPSYQLILPNQVIQADLLFLPDDDGYKYCLTVVDLGSRLIEGEPIKNKEAKSVKEGFEAIFKRKVINMPEYQAQF